MVRYVSSPGWGQSVPFLVVILAMTVHGQALPLRSHLTDKLPELGRGLFRPRLLATGLVAGLLLTWLTPSDWADALVLTFVGGIVCLSLVVHGIRGAAITGAVRLRWDRGPHRREVGGCPRPAVPGPRSCWGPWELFPRGSSSGSPRSPRGVNLAIATFGCAFAVQNIVFSNRDYTGQLQVHPTLFGWSNRRDHPPRDGMRRLPCSRLPSRPSSSSISDEAERAGD